MNSTAHFSTKDRILTAAEELFALHGFAGTSLRQVTSKADVNIAAVNYHFGSKDNLVNEVFRRRMDEMSKARIAQLRNAQQKDPCDMHALLAAFIEPALAVVEHNGAFVRVLARAYVEKNDKLRQFLSENYGHVLREFAKAIAPCVPQLSKAQLYWRLDFTIGALTYTMADFGTVKRREGVTEGAHRERAAQELIQFAEAGLRA